MKKLLCLALALTLCAAVLAGCGKKAEAPSAPTEADFAPSAPDVTAVPEEGYHGEEDQSAALQAMPTLEPVVPLEGGGADEPDVDAVGDYYSIDALLNDAPDTAPDPTPEAAPTPAEGEGEASAPVQKAVDTSTYQYSALTDTSLGFTFNYPSHWENLPGVYTICFREKVEQGDFPARVAITVKKLVHTPDELAITEQLTSYLRLVHNQYEAKTFQAGTPNNQETFLGKPALSNTYLAYSGDHEVKGYIIGTAVGKTMYVFHFCATYEDYGAMESMMRYMVKSAELIEQPE